MSKTIRITIKAGQGSYSDQGVYDLIRLALTEWEKNHFALETKKIQDVNGNTNGIKIKFQVED